MNEREKQMKAVGIKMSLCMGVTLSFFLSLTGSLASRHFTVQGWLINFVISTVISLIIGFAVPVRRLSEAACSKLNMSPGRFSTRCLESLISDLIYTPVITFFMVFFAYRKAVSLGAQIPFLPMFLSSLVICLIAGFVLIMIFMPLYLKLLTGGAGPGGSRK